MYISVHVLNVKELLHIIDIDDIDNLVNSFLNPCRLKKKKETKQRQIIYQAWIMKHSQHDEDSVAFKLIWKLIGIKLI